MQLEMGRWSLANVLSGELDVEAQGSLTRLSNQDWFDRQPNPSALCGAKLGSLRGRSLCIALSYPERSSLISIGFSGFATRSAFKQQVQAISATRLAERAIRLPDSDDKSANGNQAKDGPDDRCYRCKSGFVRRFLRGDGGAPLGAQVGSIVVLCGIAAVGISIAIRPIRGRL